MDEDLDAKTLNLAGRMRMIDGYRTTPHGSPLSEHFKKAEELFRRAHEADPANAHYTLNIADVLFAQGRIEEANAYYADAAAGLRPGSGHLSGVIQRWGSFIARKGPSSRLEGEVRDRSQGTGGDAAQENGDDDDDRYYGAVWPHDVRD